MGVGGWGAGVDWGAVHKSEERCRLFIILYSLFGRDCEREEYSVISLINRTLSTVNTLLSGFYGEKKVKLSVYAVFRPAHVGGIYPIQVFFKAAAHYLVA